MIKDFRTSPRPGGVLGDRVKEALFNNFSYKLVSLFIAMILWLTILGRRDFTVVKAVDLEVLVAAGSTVVSQSTDKVRVKVSGPRTALRKFMDSGFAQQITVDLTQRSEGEFDVDVPANRLDVPFGIRVLQIKPASVKVTLKKNSN